MTSSSSNNQSKPSFGDSERGDVHDLHLRIYLREQREPEEGLEPTPRWVWVAGVLLLFVAGFYLGRYGGSFTEEVHQLESRHAEPALGGAEQRPPVRGDVIYANVCTPCHQANGLGIKGQYPPLARSEWLLANAEVPIHIVLNGLEGPLRVQGMSYNSKMPAHRDKLSVEEIAAVLTYARSSWGNSAPAVTTEMVQKVASHTSHGGPWTSQLLREKLEDEN